MRHLLLPVVLLLLSLLPRTTRGESANAPPEYASIPEWLYAASVKWQPPYGITSTASSPFSESIDDHIARRKQIAADLWAAASDPKTPVLFTGPRGRELTAIFVMGIWKVESEFDLRVDKHHCAGMPKGYCDSGAAWCLGQVHPADVPQLGYSGQELQADNVKCARATIVRLAAARSLAPKTAPHDGDLFCGYAVGHFESPCPKMRYRYSFGAQWSKHHPPPVLPALAP